jgi:aminoglycoside 6'-N-acetyltransferase
MDELVRGPRIVLRPVEPRDAERLRALRAAPEVAAWWHGADEGWPLAPDEDERYYVIEHGDRVAGFIEAWEEPDPDFRHAGIDLFLGPEHIGRGLGAEAVRALCLHLFEDRGHHRVTIDPEVANTRAIRCYERVGFRRVGVMRAYCRDATRREWRDGLHMELLAGELR